MDGCAVNFGATVMSGAVMERDTTLLPLALVLKEMKLVTATYEGSPAEPVTEQSEPAIPKHWDKKLSVDAATLRNRRS